MEARQPARPPPQLPRSGRGDLTRRRNMATRKKERRVLRTPAAAARAQHNDQEKGHSSGSDLDVMFTLICGMSITSSRGMTSRCPGRQGLVGQFLEQESGFQPL